MGQICGKIKSSSTESDGESSNKKKATYVIPEKTLQVFENSLLREKILGYVITNAAATWKDICSLRLVQKVWLRDVAKILHDSRRPFFQLILTEISFPNRKGYRRGNEMKYMKSLDHLISIMENSFVDPPPLHLKIQKDFFRDENHQSFSDFLKSGHCASSLASLEIIAPRNGGSMTFLFPSPISFPNLKKLTITFSGGNITPAQNTSSTVPNNGSNSNFIPFIQSILNGTKTLVEFNGAPNLVPHGIKYLDFPGSLTELHLNCALDSNQLQVLVKNSLPNLTRLALVTINNPLIADMLFRILDNVKATLSELYISSEGRIYQIPIIPNSLQFPVMKCLETCVVDTTFVELETQLLLLQAYLPKLKRMELIFQTYACFRKWSDSACFSTVSHVSLTFANLRKFTLEEMQVLYRAFPNVTWFTLDVHFVEMEALQYLFQEMRQLTELRIRLGDVTSQEMSYHWDSLLIGLPDLFARSQLENNPCLLSQNFNLPSIKNLTALRKLELSTATTSRHFAFKQYLISDLAFHHAILQMPSLKFVQLAGAFMPSPSMRSHLNLLNTHEDSDSDAVYICHF